jgi:hypothetical protein
MATIIGGGTVQTGLPGGALNTEAQNAIGALSQGYTTATILTNPNQQPGGAPGTLYVYDIPGKGKSFTLPAGAGGVVLTGNKPTSLTGHGGTELLVGNSGPDTINAGSNGGQSHTGAATSGVPSGGTTTMIGGNAANEFIANGGSNLIEDGKGANRIYLTGGQDTVVTLGVKDQIHVSATDLTVSGTATVIGKGHDTISLLGSGSKVIEAGSATVTGTGRFTFSAEGAGRGSHESVQAGSGRNTLIGGHRTNVFAAGSGFSSMVAGSGSRDTFIGGSGNSFMDAGGSAGWLSGGGARVVFQFDSSHGGHFTHTIAHFQHGKDHLDLVGYDSAAALHSAHVKGGNTILTLDDGTKIILKGFTGLKASDFS